MQILKVMNNSLVLAIDDSGNECILMGKGIGYKKSLGSDVLPSEIEKTFILKDKAMLKNFVQLASELDDIYFNIVKETIEYASQQYDMEVMDYLYLSLSDHIAFAISRIHEGHVGENFNYIEVVKFHKNEYEVGKYAVQLINKKLNVQLPDSEASAIGLHFVNARLNSKSYNKEIEVVKLVRDIEAIVARKSNTIFDKESFFYSRFITHLRYFADRIIDNQIFEDKESDTLYDQLNQNMKQETEIINSISQFIKHKYDVQLTNQEKTYLIIHIHRIVSEKSN
ncbi:PRD domain-containing protein [Lysinibacillus piscis]|uniref:Transcriptional regulator n=1 Tax=Lysinibacillus piscis TaxID=2518931 RepID=A0ABQ5NP00_9BACI|nr:PRD domain-containing protein [Lysinibacillus sp. KH24]GLC90085.1 transcriptional regulator [Lysinibacillus sp. KH24]